MVDIVPVGEGIHYTEQIAAMPVGTVIAVATRPSQTYTKIADGEWAQYGREHRTHRDGDFSPGGYNVVVSYPAGTDVTPAVHTALRYRWKFRQHVLQAQAAHSVSESRVVRALQQLQADEDAFTLGPGLVVGCVHDLNRLPNGTVARYGDPVHYRMFGLFVMRRGIWRPALGERTVPGLPVTIERYQDSTTPPDWWTAVATDGDTAEIAAFKALAWKVGWATKQDAGWCSTYESVMRSFGITESDSRVRPSATDGSRVGMTVGPHTAGLLPVGTVLCWRARMAPRTRVAWFIRTDLSSNQARTRRVFTHRDDGVEMGHYADSMRVEYVPSPDAEMDLDVDLVTVWEDIPPGTVIHSGGGWFVMARDHRVSALATPVHRGALPFHGTYGRDAFTADRITGMRVVSFPRGI